jgi:hypothetical protein
MATWCLLPQLADKFLGAVKNGEIDVAKFNELSSEDRVATLRKYVGDDAERVNLNFENALLLKNQDAALINWIKKTSGMDDAKKAGMLKNIEDSKNARESRLYTPTENQGFLGSVLKQKFGVDITPEEAKTIYDLKKKLGSDAPTNVHKLIDSLSSITDKTPEQSKLIKSVQDKLLESKVASKMDQTRIAASTEKDLMDRLKNSNISDSPTSKAFIQKLVEQKNKIEITPDEAHKAFTLTNEMNAVKDKGAGFSGVSEEYMTKRNALNDYINSFRNVGPVKSIIGNVAVTGRNILLSNPSTPIKTFESAALNSLSDAITRRIYGKTLTGHVSDLASQATKEAWQHSLKTGWNEAGMENMDDHNALGKGEDFNVPQQAIPGKLGPVANLLGKTTSLVAKYTNKVIIDWAHKLPFNFFYQKNFYDILNVVASKVADSEGLVGDEARARTEGIFRDAARIEPKTDEGKAIRKSVQTQVSKVLNTNDTFGSRLSLGMKNMLNKAWPGARLGDYIVPIAKIPSNVIWNGLENAGLGLPRGIKDFFEGKRDMASTDPETKLQGAIKFESGVKQLIKIGGSLATAYLLTSQLQKNDFRTDKYGKSFVKVGGTWVNTEYISAVSPTLAGMMAIKQSGNNADYLAGATSGLKALPGVDSITSAFNSISSFKTLGDSLSAAIKSRTEPGVVANLFKDRPINRLIFGAQGVETEAEMASDTSNKIDLSKSTSAKINQFKNKVGDVKFQSANNDIKILYSKYLNELNANPVYKNMSDADKLLRQQQAKVQAENVILKKYHFTYRPDKKNKIKLK